MSELFNKIFGPNWPKVKFFSIVTLSGAGKAGAVMPPLSWLLWLSGFHVRYLSL